jgi:transposase
MQNEQQSELLRSELLRSELLLHKSVLQWREADNIAPAASFLSSPYDLEAHLAKKGSNCWVGYKVHFTETCEAATPPLITHIETTAAPLADGDVTPVVHQALQDKGLLPQTHIVDTGYLDAALLVSSQKEYGVDLLGPTRPDLRWQARAGEGFDAQHFQVAWDKQQATCPQGHTSLSWTPAVDNRDNQVIKIKFSAKHCRVCPSRPQCCRSQKKYPRRTVTIRPQEEYAALQAARERAGTQAYMAEYARRAGIEGTLSRGVRTCEMRRSRYMGLAKVHLGHVLTAVAINFLRIAEWLAGAPRAQARQSAFARLMAATA